MIKKLINNIRKFFDKNNPAFWDTLGICDYSYYRHMRTKTCRNWVEHD